MPLIFTHPQSPPNGHHFKDPSGVTLKADTLRGLLDGITGFRAINGLPPGNPHQEVESTYGTLYPWLVTKVGATPASAEDPVARWIGRIWRAPPKEKDLAESETTRHRLEQCAACPHYEPDHGYDATATRRLTILSHARMTDFSACKAHHWAVGLAALIEKPEIQAPVEDCWAALADQSA